VRLAEELVLGKLASLDRVLAETAPPRVSMGPGRAVATSFRELGLRAASHTADPRVLGAFGEALLSIVEAERQNFPDNIFADLDYLAAALLRDALAADMGPVVYLREATDLIVTLHGLFGVHSAIRFRYTHDFRYGFDWARWVQKEPAARGGIGPFDLPFLHYSRDRGRELLALIAADDKKYPKLPDGTPRNPFAFSREPDDERRVHEALARDGLIPVAAWDPDALPTPDLPYSELRAERAKALMGAADREQ
jgi:hypothetical protein